MSTTEPRRQHARAAVEEPGSTKKRPNPSAPSNQAGNNSASAASASQKPQFGRRSSHHNTKKEDGGSTTDAGAADRHSGAVAERRRVKDAVPENLKTVGDEETNATASAALLAKQREEKEKLAKAVAEVPTGYQAQMPLLTDLDIKNSWDKLVQSIHGEFDMTYLTACLARELDEDVTWNPEMLRVQLTSDMRDAAELKGEEANYAPVEDHEIGLMKGGEVSRKRKEKGAPDESPVVPQEGAKAPGSPTLVPSKRKPSVIAPKDTRTPRKKVPVGSPSGEKSGDSTRRFSSRESSPRMPPDSRKKGSPMRKKSRDSSIAPDS